MFLFPSFPTISISFPFATQFWAINFIVIDASICVECCWLHGDPCALYRSIIMMQTYLDRICLFDCRILSCILCRSTFFLSERGSISPNCLRIYQLNRTAAEKRPVRVSMYHLSLEFYLDNWHCAHCCLFIIWSLAKLHSSVLCILKWTKNNNSWDDPV